MKLSIIVIIGLLSGCTANSLPYETFHPPEYAGINFAEIEAQCPKDAFCPKKVRIVGGKEQENITVQYHTAGETKTLYEAKGVKAFPGQKLRAQVEQALAETQGEAAPEVVAAIMDTVRRAWTGG